MKEKIRWLVITPTLGTSPFLAETISSISHLPGLVEHIIVCPIEAKDKVSIISPTTRIITEPPGGSGGMYGAINIGLNAAKNKYDYFCYINDDDFFLPDISKTEQFINKNRNVIFYGKTMMVDGNSKSLYQAPFSWFSKITPIFLTHRIIPFMQPSMIVPHAVMDKLGDFDASYRYCGDIDFILRAISFGVDFKFLNYRTAAFRLHKGQLSGSHSNMSIESDLAFKKINLKSSRISFKRIILKFIFLLSNTKSYIDRFKSMKALTSSQVFYGSKLH